MDLLSPRARHSGVEQRPRGTLFDSLALVRAGGMALLAMLLAGIFVVLVCG